MEITSQNMTIVDGILSMLPETEFKLGRKFSTGLGFHGDITEKGLDKLAKNPDVKAIYYDGIVYPVSE